MNGKSNFTTRNRITAKMREECEQQRQQQHNTQNKTKNVDSNVMTNYHKFYPATENARDDFLHRRNFQFRSS